MSLPADATLPDSDYEFRTGEFPIQLHITHPPRYEGRRLEIYRSSDPANAVCPAKIGGQECSEHFVGAVAVVEFLVTRLVNGKPASGSIREVVILVDQSPGLPPQPLYEMSIKLIKGLGSDLQAFGYDEESLPPAERPAEREVAKQAWRRFRQELFLNNDRQPFAVVQWMHTTTGIQVLGVEEPRRVVTYPKNPPAP